MKSFTLVLMAAVMLIQPVLAEPPLLNSSQVKPLMRMKLERAKNVLEGLTMEDFEKVRSNAAALKVLSLESGWNLYQTTKYRKQSEDFRRSIDGIVESANDKDINRAALGYVSLTVRCVECHNYLRKNKVELMNFYPAK